MAATKRIVNEAADRIVELIKARCGGVPIPAVNAMRRLCRHEFGVPARPIFAPLDFFGQVSGDIGGDNAVIVFNGNQPNRLQIRTLLHELAEYLAARDMPGLWDYQEDGARFLYTGTDAPEELRHQVAVRVESLLAAEMGIDDDSAPAKTQAAMRTVPFDLKYARPRSEIERMPADD